MTRHVSFMVLGMMIFVVGFIVSRQVRAGNSRKLMPKRYRLLFWVSEQDGKLKGLRLTLRVSQTQPSSLAGARKRAHRQGIVQTWVK